jgi:hypothetical protein
MRKRKYITISQVCRRYPGARGAQRIAPSTVTRWIISGCPSRTGERVKLTAIRAGRHWLIRPSDLDTFFATLARSTDSGPAPTIPTQSSERKTSERGVSAGRELENRGA